DVVQHAFLGADDAADVGVQAIRHILRDPPAAAFRREDDVKQELRIRTGHVPEDSFAPSGREEDTGISSPRVALRFTRGYNPMPRRGRGGYDGRHGASIVDTRGTREGVGTV